MSEIPQIPPPSSGLSTVPDKDTKKGLPDYTAREAPERVLHINLWFFKYGTNDKAHAAALVLSVLLLSIIVGVIIFINSEGAASEWADRVFGWLGSAFMFISGIALGKGSNGDIPPKPPVP
jgi:hypothetical protein